jgi:glycosyltransferase involved in cell wall biosynthesis
MLTRRKIRVAHCIDSFGIGGTELNAVRTVEALDPNRFEILILHLQKDGPLRARYERLGVQLVHVPILNLHSLRTARQGIRIARLLRTWETDVVHTHDLYTNIFVVPWARTLTRCKIIASRRWWYEAPRPALVPINRLSYLFAHRVLANSPGVARLLSLDEKVPAEKIIEISNFLDDRAFEAVGESEWRRQRRSWGVPDGATVAGIVARLQPVKNHEHLLRALAQLNERVHLVIVGDGPSRRALERMARDLLIESRVHFVGEVLAPENLHQYFDLSLLCSTSEGFPNSVIEAMAAARPVVATSVGGVPDAIVEGETGLLVPSQDLARLVEALRLLESDSSLRSRLGNAARESARSRFHKRVVIEKLSRIYESLADYDVVPAQTEG